MMWPPVPPPAMRTRNCVTDLPSGPPYGTVILSEGRRGDRSRRICSFGTWIQVHTWRELNCGVAKRIPQDPEANAHHSICLEIFSSTPIPARVKNSDVPPDEISGSGI